MLCVLLTAMLTTLGWIVLLGVLLMAVALLTDRLAGRPKWTPDSYCADPAKEM